MPNVPTVAQVANTTGAFQETVQTPGLEDQSTLVPSGWTGGSGGGGFTSVAIDPGGAVTAVANELILAVAQANTVVTMPAVSPPVGTQVGLYLSNSVCSGSLRPNAGQQMFGYAGNIAGGGTAPNPVSSIASSSSPTAYPIIMVAMFVGNVTGTPTWIITDYEGDDLDFGQSLKGPLDFNGGLYMQRTATPPLHNSNYTTVAADTFLKSTGAGGPFTYTLGSFSGQVLFIVNQNTHSLTLTPGASIDIATVPTGTASIIRCRDSSGNWDTLSNSLVATGAVTSVTAADGSNVITPTTGAVTVSSKNSQLILTGLTGDNGLTDNYATINTQLTAFAALGGGDVIVPAALGYFGISQDLVMSNYAGVSLRGRGAYTFKGPGSVGNTPYRSAIGPYTAGAAPAVSTWTHGVIQLVGGTAKGATIENLAVLGINSVNGTANNAPTAVYCGGTGNHGPQIRNCLLWGGNTSVLWIDTNGNDTVLENVMIDNDTYAGAVAIGASPTGLCVWVNAPDCRFSQVQSYQGPWQIGTTGGADFMAVGCHLSDVITANVPTLYLSSTQGGMFTDCTIDNGATGTPLVAHVERNTGTWGFVQCNFLNRSGQTWPIFSDDNTDTAHGFVVTNCKVVNNAGAQNFSGLLNTATGTSNLNNSFDGINIDNNALGTAGPGGPTLWLAAGSITSTVLPGVARRIIQQATGGLGVLQPEIPVSPTAFSGDVTKPGGSTVTTLNSTKNVNLVIQENSMVSALARRFYR
jgi:hypothetical protein